jgi:ferritin-like metal-binding protein YciE
VSVQSPPRIETKRDLLLSDLAQLLTVEGTLARIVLPELSRQVSDQELKEALESHLAETKEHAESLKWAFDQVGEKPQGKDAPGLDGLRAEQQAIEEVAPSLRDSFVAGAAMAGEHYEIAVYSSILPVAQQVSPGPLAETLQRILEQEFTALRKLETIAERLAAS